MTIKFRTAYDGDTSKYYSDSGSKFLDQYAFEFDEKGEVRATTLHKTDKPLNVYERIQADYPSTDINLLMERFALGDTSAINVREGAYIDVTKMPSNFAELFDRINETQRIFDELPADLKQEFNNSYEEFWSEYGTDEFFSKVDNYNDRFIDHSYDEPVIDESGDVSE